MSEIKIIYASTSGNTEVVSEVIADILKVQGYNCELFRAELTPIEVVRENHTFIFATSTWEHGDINPYFNELLKEMKKMNMDGKIAGFVGLGDTRYEEIKFAKGIEILKKVFLNGGGKQIHTTLKLNGDPYEHLYTTVKEWAYEFAANLVNA